MPYPNSLLDIMNGTDAYQGAVLETLVRNLTKRNLVPFTSLSQSNEAALSNGTTLGSLAKFAITAECDGQGIALAFGNWGSRAGAAAAAWAEQPGPYAYTIEWGVWQGATFIQGTTEGKQVFSLEPGAFVITDQLNMNIVTGTTYYVQWRIAVTAGQTFQRSFSTFYTSTTDALNNGASDGDAIPAIGTTQTTGLTGIGVVHLPLAFLTSPKRGSEKAVPLVMGDSIAFGSNDTATAFNTAAYRRLGHFSKGLYDIGLPHIRLTLPSDLAQYTTDWQAARRFGSYIKSTGVTHALLEYGINDIGSSRTVAADGSGQVQQDLITLANQLIAMGISKVGLSTLGPRTDGSTSSTLWSRTNVEVPGNQTSHTSAANLNIFNTWARTVPSPFSFVQDHTALLEVSPGSNTWKNGGLIASMTATGGSTTTAVVSSLAGTLTTGYYQDYVIKFTSGTNSGTYKRVTAYTGSSGTFTFAAVSAVTNGDTFELYESYTNDGLHPNWRGCLIAKQAIKSSFFL